MRVLRAFTDGVFECQRIELDQFVSWLDLRTSLDHPDDSALTSDLAFDFRVLRTLQSPLLDDRDEQIATPDRVSQLRTGLLRRPDARNQPGSRRYHGDHSDRQQTAFPPSAS